MGLQIEALDTPTSPEALLRELAGYYTIVESEEIPGDPPTPAALKIADWRNVVSHYPVKRWLLREDGHIVAVAVAAYDIEQNLENGFGRIHVHPARRGRGHGRRIAAPVLEHLEEQGRHRLETYVKQGDPAEQLVERLGLKSVYGERRSRLRIDELDRELMRSWISRASERASEYEIVSYEVPFPDDILDRFCEMTFIMNTAPREEVVEDDEVLTPDNWREVERTILESRCRLHTMIAVHRPTRAFAGYTQIKTQDLQPDLAWNWDTAVDPSHRNKGLGRWLKASMIEMIVSEFPEVERVDTFNAGSNEPMLNINIAMGFKPVYLSNVWQGELSVARERLGV